MTLDDLKKIFMSPSLFRLDTIWSSRLVPVFYITGLFVILLMAVRHLFWTFGYGFSAGMWGLLEILVYGLFYILILRIACEGVLVFFKAHESTTAVVAQNRMQSTLLDEVRDAIHDLAEDEEDQIIDADSPVEMTEPETVPLSTVRRTAKRTPPIKP